MADSGDMNDLIDSEGFRANVGIVLMRGSGEVFLGRRSTGGRGWQFPQGGMGQGEGPEQALYRELHEETGLAQEDVTLLGRTGDWLRYRLPSRYIRRNRHPLCIGQKQRWFLLRLNREDATFALDASAEPEFDQWRWASYWEPVREVIYFKRAVYVQALKELAPIAFPHGPPAAPSWLEQLAEPAVQAVDAGEPG
ncbi:MAG: RNA pyrophosphohydrolase [Steroidobacteraceae bacterium]